MRTPILLLAAVVLPRAAAADEVFLKGGGQLSGRVVEGGQGGSYSAARIWVG